jgi:hypothetical protein
MTTKTKKTTAKTTSNKKPTKRPATKGQAPLLDALPVPAAKTARASAKAVGPAKKPARVSMWGTARELIRAGKTNADVLAALRGQFGLPEKHNFYPVWYRAYAVKHGVVTREFAKTHAGPPIARKPALA